MLGTGEVCITDRCQFSILFKNIYLVFELFLISLISGTILGQYLIIVLNFLLACHKLVPAIKIEHILPSQRQLQALQQGYHLLGSQEFKARTIAYAIFGWWENF